MAGRPTTYEPVLIDLLCERLRAGALLVDVTREPGMPTRTTLDGWLRERPEDAAMVKAAMHAGYDILAREALEIADTPVVGETVTESPDGTTVRREDALARAKLRVDTRMRLLAKWYPEKYGERLALAGDKDAPLVVREVVVQRLTDEGEGGGK